MQVTEGNGCGAQRGPVHRSLARPSGVGWKGSLEGFGADYDGVPLRMPNLREAARVEEQRCGVDDGGDLLDDLVDGSPEELEVGSEHSGGLTRGILSQYST